MSKQMSDIEYCENICRLEGELAMLEDELEHNRNPFQRKEYQSLLYEKRKQHQKAVGKYNSFIIRHNNT